MNLPPTGGEIGRWFPQKWSEIAGNTKIIQLWWNLLLNGLCNCLFTGPSRTGKTRIVMLGIKSLLCQNRLPTNDPCGCCQNCKGFEEDRHSLIGIFANANESRYEFKVIDCERVSREELMELPRELNLDDPNVIIYLDEVAALGRRGLEGLLLKVIDESRSKWLASAVRVKQLSKKGKTGYRPDEDDRDFLSLPMQNRFVEKVGTTFPSEAELTGWIKDRCQDWSITIIQEDVSIPLMIKITKRRIGFVIHILAAAANRGRRIDSDWLSSFNITPED